MKKSVIQLVNHVVVLVMAIALIASCSAQQVQEPPVVLLTIDGNVVAVVDETKPHPCEGNWNFCDQVMEDLDTFYIPAF